MKTERRHDLETNELARHLAGYLVRIKPHLTTLIAVLAIIVVVFVAGNYMRRASAARSGEAWDAYNLAVEGRVPDLDLLKQSAEIHAGTAMAHWSDITWADGQLFAASRLYVQNRRLNERLAKAEGVYANLGQAAGDSRVRDRALFGQARVYEIRGQLPKAREAYARVAGAFAELAQQRIESIDSDQTKETYDWLVSAQPPRSTAPAGPGTPGQKPDFQVDGFTMPGDEADQSESLDDILDRFERDTAEQTSDRYRTEEGQAEEADAEPQTGTAAETDAVAAEAGDTDPAAETETPAVNDDAVATEEVPVDDRQADEVEP